LNKILNVSKFIMQFDKPKKVELTKTDELFIDYIEELTSFIDERYNSYDFHHPALKLRNFLWEIFASHYLEIIKARAYNQENQFSKEESESSHYTLHYLLERFLVLIYPIIPQITSVIAKDKNIDLVNSKFPKRKKTTLDTNLIEKIMKFNREVWKTKKERGISLRDSISGIKIPTSLKDFETDLKTCHKLE